MFDNGQITATEKMMMIRILFALAFCVYLVTPLIAQPLPNIPTQVYTTQKIEGESPTLDGMLNESAWTKVVWSTAYTQREPDFGEAPLQQTAFKILYDEDFVYVGFRCFDTAPDEIVKRMSRRDGFDGDWVEINFDSYNDKRTAFSFTVSASGVRGDEFVSNDGQNWDANWNPIWFAKTNIDEQGWTAEMKIPLSQLRYADAENQVWGIQSTRRIFRNEERSTWQPIPQNAGVWVSAFGELRGLKNLKPQRQIELQPYVVTQLERS
ncbi:MAG: carbohydrate binding family 9 domain-containing protein, partial [Bacteroidota bacterium]